MEAAADNLPGDPAVPQNSRPAGPTNPLRLIWAALWFHEAAYAEVRDSPNPFGRGLVVALLLAAISAVSGALGLGLDWLVSPDSQAARRAGLETMQASEWYRGLAQGPGGREFEQQAQAFYDLWWQVAPFITNLPSPAGLARYLCLTPAFSVLGWLFFGSLTFAAARLLGGRGGFGPTLGVLALAGAPQAFDLFTVWPGLEIGALSGWWSLALAYWAVRSVHGLGWGRNLMAVLLARLVLSGLMLALLVVGLALAAANLGPLAAGG